MKRQLTLLLTPSMFSVVFGVVVIVLLLFVATYLIFSETYASELSVIEQQIAGQSAISPSAIAETVNQSPIAANASLFLFWCVVGAACFALVSALYHGVRSSVTVADFMVHHSLGTDVSMGVEILLQLVIRVLGVAVLYAVGLIAQYAFIIYIASISLLSVNFSLVEALINGFILIAAVAVVVHGLAVGMRLLLLRPRVFGNP